MKNYISKYYVIIIREANKNILSLVNELKLEQKKQKEMGNTLKSLMNELKQYKKNYKSS